MRWKRVLVIDDNPEDAHILRYLLAKVNLYTIHARTVKEAFELIKDNPVDMIVCDIFGINGDGFAFVRRAREMHSLKKIPIIAITGVDITSEDVARARALGFDHYVRKPTDMTELAAQLKTFVEPNEPKG